MSDAKSNQMHSDPNSQNRTVVLDACQFNALVRIMQDSMQDMIRTAMLDTMSVKDFAAARGVSMRLVWQWIDEGVLLVAPTKTSPGKDTSTKRSRTLINVKAWRDKLTQQAIDCRYIDRRTAFN
ncbi:Cro/Cl family transcriptional regulator [Cronobacter malonaticus]|uniref:Cro/Cl family transcriptional regulator n=1 Tax=Cronobacter dublinensis TaxID=413497 RepID=UPI00273840DF|nr:Cro/Cl family transcriptional regulator [Cronobacter dublinensis]ELY4584749.1 Cro/Cl family transcriptional regulator [Cronobacter malonaticus]